MAIKILTTRQTNTYAGAMVANAQRMAVVNVGMRYARFIYGTGGFTGGKCILPNANAATNYLNNNKHQSNEL